MASLGFSRSKDDFFNYNLFEVCPCMSLTQITYLWVWSKQLLIIGSTRFSEIWSFSFTDLLSENFFFLVSVLFCSIFWNINVSVFEMFAFLLSIVYVSVNYLYIIYVWLGSIHMWVHKSSRSVCRIGNILYMFKNNRHTKLWNARFDASVYEFVVVNSFSHFLNEKQIKHAWVTRIQPL